MALIYEPDCPNCGAPPLHMWEARSDRPERRTYQCHSCDHRWVVDDIKDALAGEAGEWV